MKKNIILILCFTLLAGCAPYRVQEGIKKPYDQGYVATREGKVILEYTVGRENKVPDDIGRARARFKRRRRTVEDYYKKMGVIENRLKEHVWNRFIYFWSIVGGVLNTPVRIVSEFRYNHNPEYRARVDQRFQKEEERHEALVEKLKAELAVYIEEDLQMEERWEAKAQEMQSVAKTP